MHEKRAYIFVGQSGSGKGTQVELLKESLEATNPLFTFFHIETGEKFRALAQQENSYAIHRMKEWMVLGKLPPSFLGIHAWAHALIYEYNAEDHVILDGAPRIADEVPVLLAALEFLEIEAVVIHITVSDAWAYEKTKNRAREDDRDEQELRGRLQWYHDQVMPVIELLKHSNQVKYFEINGEQTIAEVHEAIMAKLKPV